jgi:transcriptional regulator with XRE-family HTH domain
MNSEFSKIITVQRKERKISQKQAAQDLGISQALLSHYEKGIRECGLSFLVKIANYYCVSCDYLLGRASEPDETFTNPDNNCDWDSQSDKRTPLSDAFLSFNKKIINNTTNYILSLAQKSGNKAFIKSVYTYFMLCAYKMFRILYNANTDNDQSIFSVKNAVAEDMVDSIIAKNQASIKAMASDDNSEIDITSLRIDSEGLSHESEYSSSLLNLIKYCEENINAN